MDGRQYKARSDYLLFPCELTFTKCVYRMKSFILYCPHVPFLAPIPKMLVQMCRLAYSGVGSNPTSDFGFFQVRKLSSYLMKHKWFYSGSCSCIGVAPSPVKLESCHIIVTVSMQRKSQPKHFSSCQRIPSQGNH